MQSTATNTSQAIIYYAPTIFGQLGLSGKTTGLLATGVYGIVNTLSTLPALFLIDKVGRRPLLLCGAAGTFISLCIVGGVIGGYGDTLKVHWLGVAFGNLQSRHPLKSYVPNDLGDVDVQLHHRTCHARYA
jgi:MFS family permease